MLKIIIIFVHMCERGLNGNINKSWGGVKEWVLGVDIV
jgi:hypothetical protein